MRLEVGTFPVQEMAFGEETRWQQGTLEVDQDEMRRLALQDPSVRRAEIDIARPGESVRIVNYRDVVEPRVKVAGPGVVYPGVFGRPVNAVGSGRTYRLGGAAVVQCADTLCLTEEERFWPPLRPHRAYFDMFGPGAVTPFSRLNNLCVTLETAPGMAAEDWWTVVGAATMRISDRLAQAVAGLEPPQVEVFDTAPKPGLPGLVSVFNLASDEWFVGARSVLGTAVYGQTRLSAPWLLSPTELMDGVVCQSTDSRVTSWLHVNNPVVMYAARRHGRECNYLGVIVQRTNWTTQAEKQMAAERLAHLARSVGAQGAILTTDIRGQRFVETILGVQALEQVGVKTVLLTEEEDDENGTAPPLLMSAPEVVSVVSTGTGGMPEPFPPVQRVLGAFQPDEAWYKAQPPVHGRYGSSYTRDYFGYGVQGCVDY